MHGAHGEDMVHVITSAEAVYKNGSELVIIPPPPMAVKGVTDMLRWSRRAILINVQVRDNCFVTRDVWRFTVYKDVPILHSNDIS